MRSLLMDCHRDRDDENENEKEEEEEEEFPGKGETSIPICSEKFEA